MTRGSLHDRAPRGGHPPPRCRLGRCVRPRGPSRSRDAGDERDPRPSRRTRPAPARQGEPAQDRPDENRLAAVPVHVRGLHPVQRQHPEDRGDPGPLAHARSCPTPRSSSSSGRAARRGRTAPTTSRSRRSTSAPTASSSTSSPSTSRSSAVVYTKNVSIETAWQTAWTRADGTAAPPRYDLVGASAYATNGAVHRRRRVNARPHVVWTATRHHALRPAERLPRASRRDELDRATPPLSSVPVGTAYPEELDPSIDIANGWVHVLYKDDQDTSDAAAKTNRYRYVRNNTQFGYSSYNAAVTVMQPAAGQNDAGLPGSVAARDNGVWITGSFLGGFSNSGTTTTRATAVRPGRSTRRALRTTCTRPRRAEAPAPIGLNSEGNDHRLYAIRRDSGTIYTYKWGGATGVDGRAAPAPSTAATSSPASPPPSPTTASTSRC